MLYTILLVGFNENSNETRARIPTICFDHDEPFLTSQFNRAEKQLAYMEKYFPDGQYKIGIITT